MNPKGYRMTVTAWSNFLRLLWGSFFLQVILARISQLATDHASSRRPTVYFLQEIPHVFSNPSLAIPGNPTQPITVFLLSESIFTIIKAPMKVPTPKTETLLFPLIRAHCFNIMPDIFQGAKPQ